MSDGTTSALILIVGIVSLGTGVFIGYYSSALNKQTQAAITACEKSLPRDKHCEYVITARVKEGE